MKAADTNSRTGESPAPAGDRDSGSNASSGLVDLKDFGIGADVQLRHEQPALGVVLVVVALASAGVARGRESTAAVRNRRPPAAIRPGSVSADLRESDSNSQSHRAVVHQMAEPGDGEQEHLAPLGGKAGTVENAVAECLGVLPIDQDVDESPRLWRGPWRPTARSVPGRWASTRSNSDRSSRRARWFPARNRPRRRPSRGPTVEIDLGLMVGIAGKPPCLDQTEQHDSPCAEQGALPPPRGRPDRWPCGARSSRSRTCDPSWRSRSICGRTASTPVRDPWDRSRATALHSARHRGADRCRAVGASHPPTANGLHETP